MKEKIIVILLLAFTISIRTYGQDSELFTGEYKLNSCKVDIPLTYKNKDKPTYIKGAKENKDTELVLLSYNKKTKKATYSIYYIVVDEIKGEVFVYLETPETHNLTTGEKQSIFSPFKVKYDRFYKADCFMKIINDNPDLNEIIKKNN